MYQSEFIFAYGSNMDPAQMRERCPESDLSWFVAEARGWKLCFPRRSERRKGGVGSIAVDETKSVWGVVFSVSARDLGRLDGFEGVPTCYRRDQITAADREGRDYVVWTYFAVPAEPPQEYEPHKHYIGLYVKGAEYFGLPPQYVEFLRGLEARTRGSAL